MSKSELSRAELMQRLVDKRLTQREAASILDLSIRQLKRLLRGYRKDGPSSLISKKRGKASNHQLPAKLKDKALTLILSRYSDFGPTLAHEKLLELHDLHLSVESVRRLMIGAGLWVPKPARRPGIHPLRPRRSALGELVQVDGSPHDWFEGRAARCTLLVFIDDATGQLMQLHFAESETTLAYFEAVEHYILSHGKPRAFYSDKFSVFRPVRKEILKGEAITQFGRAMKELDIEIICANTPQAKGRVERVNQTLQDRLVKELRLQQISSMQEANQYAAEFIRAFNKKFAVEAKSRANAHRKLSASERLERILVMKESRSLSKNLQLSYKGVIYQIETKRPTYTMRRATVRVRENSQGEINIEYKGKELAYKVYDRQPRQAEVKDAKQIQAAREYKPANKGRKPYVPPADHAWRKFRLSGTPQSKPVEQR
jgi:transposase